VPKLTIDIEGQLANFQDSLNRLEREASGIGRRLESAFGGAKLIFAGLATAVAGIGLTRLVKDAIDTADALQDLSDRTDTAVEGLSALQYAARLNGVTNEGLEAGLKQLSKSIAENAGAFEDLGVSVKGVGLDQVLSVLSQRLKGIEDPVKRNEAMFALLKKSAFELKPLLVALGDQGLKPFADEAERTGNIISGKTARAANEFKDNLDRLRMSVEGIGKQIAAELLGPISQMTADFLDAGKAAGSLMGAISMIATGEGGNNAGRKLLEIEERLKAIRAEREKLKGSIGDSEFVRSLPKLPGLAFISKPKDLEYEEASLLVQRDRLKVLQQIRAERVTQESAPQKKRDSVDFENDESKAARAREAARKAAEAERELEAKVREVGRQTAAEAADRAAVASAQYTYQTQQAAKAADELNSILARTPTGQLQELERQQLILNDALVAGKINAKEFTEGFDELDKIRKQVLAPASDDISEFAQKAKRDIDELKTAILGFGRRSADALAEFVVSGKFNFHSLIQSMIKDLISMLAYKALFGPLFGAIGSGLFGGANTFAGSAKGNVFGSSGLVPFAAGGVVTRPTIFPFANGTGLMGEAGPEAIMPLKRGPGGRLGVEASGGGGGVVIQQTNYFTGGADPATMSAWAYANKMDILNTLARQRSRGQI
jgi:lambda family phage tail tape measure protein